MSFVKAISTFYLTLMVPSGESGERQQCAQYSLSPRLWGGGVGGGGFAHQESAPQEPPWLCPRALVVTVGHQGQTYLGFENQDKSLEKTQEVLVLCTQK